jgi:serine/threonine-protein kinase
MAEVYLGEARDGEEPRIAALKIIRHAAHTEELLQRFQRERRILDRIRHRNIARFYGGGMSEDGRPYLAMEYVEGRTIERYCDEEKLPITERLRLFLQVTQAVDLAHSHQVIHRDIKPSNILVTAEGMVKLLDFGIARLLEGSEVSSVVVPLTMSNSRLMTPAYASPELIQSARVEAGSDIYQLGLLLYLLLTGRWPYPVFRRPPGDVVRRVCRQEPLTPSDAVIDPDAPRPPEGGTETPEDLAALRATTPARLHLALSGRLDGILLRALAKAPGDRFASVAGMMGAIEGFVGPGVLANDGA